MSLVHIIEFVRSGRGKAQCPPNPLYPAGIEVDVTRSGQPGCVITLPYPAPECGHYRVECNLCHSSAALTAAGRVDDPRSIKIPCRLPAGEPN